MGTIYTTLTERLSTKKDLRILLMGFEASGKTTILYKLKFGQNFKPFQHFPTIGSNNHGIQHKNFNFKFCDIGLHGKAIPLRRHYYSNTQGIIFVVDSNERNDYYITEAREELNHCLYAKEMRDAVFLIFANKQDLPNAMSVEEITDMLGLNNLKTTNWHVQGAVATTGQGLYEGLDWLSDQISKQIIAKPNQNLTKINKRQEISNLFLGKLTSKP